jgi:predicted MFS family arabinose efflux permease
MHTAPAPSSAPTPTTTTTPPPPLPPLPRNFSRLAACNLAAQSAEQIALAAVPLFAVLAFQAGPGEVGLLSSAQTLPFLLLSIPLGLLADRWSRQRLMLWAEGLRALSLLALVWVAVQGHASLAWLAVLGFIGAVGTVGFSVAAPALVPSLVPPSALAAANGRLELARSLAFAAGPALGGALVGWVGASFAFALAAGLSLAAWFTLAGVHEPARTQPPRRHPVTELKEGAGLVLRHPLLRPVLVTAIVWNLAWFVLQAAYVPYAVTQLGLDGAGVGFTLATYGAGMVTGSLLAARAIRALPYGIAVLVGPWCSVAAMTVMCATLVWPSGVLAGLSFFLFGLGPILWTISSTTLRQHLTPAAMLGRVSAIFLTVNAGARPIGAALGGWVGAGWGAEACLWLALAGFLAQAAVCTLSPMRGLKALPAPVH